LLVLVAIFGGSGIYLWETNPPGPGWINYLKIRNGMTVEEVVRLMGRPKGSVVHDRRTGACRDVWWWRPDKPGSHEGVMFCISTDEADRVAKPWFLTTPIGH